MTDHEIALLKEIGQQRAINRLYRTCYSLLQEFQKRVQNIADDLLLLYQSDTPNTPFMFLSAQEMASGLEEAIKDIGEVEENAFASWRCMAGSSTDTSAMEEKGVKPQGWYRATTPDKKIFVLNHVRSCSLWGGYCTVLKWLDNLIYLSRRVISRPPKRKFIFVHTVYTGRLVNTTFSFCEKENFRLCLPGGSDQIVSPGQMSASRRATFVPLISQWGPVLSRICSVF